MKTKKKINHARKGGMYSKNAIRTSINRPNQQIHIDTRNLSIPETESPGFYDNIQSKIVELVSKLRKDIICSTILSNRLTDYKNSYEKYKKALEGYCHKKCSKSVMGFFHHDLIQVLNIIEKARSVHIEKTKKQERDNNFYKNFGTSLLDVFSPTLNTLQLKREILKTPNRELVSLTKEEDEALERRLKFFKHKKQENEISIATHIQTMCYDLCDFKVINNLFDSSKRASSKLLENIMKAYIELIANQNIDKSSSKLSIPVKLPDEVPDLEKDFSKLSIGGRKRKTRRKIFIKYMKTSKTKRFGTKTRRNKFTRKGGMMRSFFSKRIPPIPMYNKLVEIIQNFRKSLICTVNDRSIMDRFRKYMEIISHYIDDGDENIKNFLISDIHQVAEIISENNPEEKYQKFEIEKETKILKFNRRKKKPFFSRTRLLNLYNNLPEDQFKIMLDSGSITHEDLDEYDRNIRRPIRENEWSCELEYLEKIRNFNSKICLELCDTAKIHELLNESINESELVQLYIKIEKEYFKKSREIKSVPINFDEVDDDDLDYIVGVGVDEEREKRNQR